MKKREINQKPHRRTDRSNITSEKTTNMLLIFMNVKIKNWCSPFFGHTGGCALPALLCVVLCLSLLFRTRKKDGTAKNVIIISLMCVVRCSCPPTKQSPLKCRRDNHGQRWIKHLIYLWGNQLKLCSLWCFYRQTHTYTTLVVILDNNRLFYCPIRTLSHFTLTFLLFFSRNTKNNRDKRCKMLLCGVS